MMKTTRLMRKAGLVAILVASLLITPLRTAIAVHNEAAEFYVALPADYIGQIESDGAVLIDGRLAHRAERLRGGELIQTPGSSGARISLDSLGQITLTSQAVVRVNVVAVGTEARSLSRVLVASLIKGEMSVQLGRGSSGYIQAGSSGFVALDGASFRVSIRDGRAMVSLVKGTVEEIGNWTVIIPSALLEAESTGQGSTPSPGPHAPGMKASVVNGESAGNRLAGATASSRSEETTAVTVNGVKYKLVLDQGQLATTASTSVSADIGKWTVHPPLEVIEEAGQRSSPSSNPSVVFSVTYPYRSAAPTPPATAPQQSLRDKSFQTSPSRSSFKRNLLIIVAAIAVGVGIAFLGGRDKTNPPPSLPAVAKPVGGPIICPAARC
jgi:hypothetical protein